MSNLKEGRKGLIEEWKSKREKVKMNNKMVDKFNYIDNYMKWLMLNN